MTYNRVLKTDTRLRARWQSLQIQNPHKSTREIAIDLAVSEEQLIATRCGHDEEGNTRLISQPTQILLELAHLGEMEFVTDNAVIKHEVTAVFSNIYSNAETTTNNTPLFSPKNVNVQFDFNDMHSIYALNEKGQLSLQFFDQQGLAVYRAYVTKKTSLEAYKALVTHYKASDQSSCKEHPFSKPYRRHYEQDKINKAQLLKTWNATTSAKECEDVIEYYDGERIAVYLSLGSLLATHLGSDTVKDLLEHLLKHEFNITITSRNTTVQQAWTGVLTHKKMQRSTLQLTGKEFKISIDTSAIGDLWLVRKFSDESGHKTVLEVYDKQQSHLMTLEEDGSANTIKDSNKWEKLMSMLVRIEQYSTIQL